MKMAVGERIAQLRKEKGMTQEDLASKVFVTRQAVSRWEKGESQPGIDMRKLLAIALDVPVLQLLDLPEEPVCQCCGAPFSVPNMEYGKDAEGNENPDFCKWCYDKGEYAYQNLDDLIEFNVPYLVEAMEMSAEEAVSFLGVMLPGLKRWSGQA